MFSFIKVFDIIGYAKTASSPEEAVPLMFLRTQDKKIMNRNNLLTEAKILIKENKQFLPPKECKFKLSGEQVRKKMHKILDKLYQEKKILEHGLEVGKELAYVLSGGKTDLSKELNENDLYNLELESFMKLIANSKTQERIAHTLTTGKPLIN